MENAKGKKVDARRIAAKKPKMHEIRKPYQKTLPWLENNGEVCPYETVTDMPTQANSRSKVSDLIDESEEDICGHVHTYGIRPNHCHVIRRPHGWM